MRTKITTPLLPAGTSLDAAAKALEDVNAKLKRLAAENTALCEDLQQHFGAERWEKIRAQCEAKMMVLAQIEATAGKALRCTRQMEPYQGNTRAELVAGANHFLCLIGSAPNEADLKALEEALKPEAKGTAETAKS